MNILTTRDAAKKLGAAEATIRRALRIGHLNGRKHGRDWIVVVDNKFEQWKLGPGGRPCHKKS